MCVLYNERFIIIEIVNGNEWLGYNTIEGTTLVLILKEVRSINGYVK